MQDIDALVDQEVTRLLPEYIPQDLQDELREHKRQLDEVERRSLSVVRHDFWTLIMDEVSSSCS